MVCRDDKSAAKTQECVDWTCRVVYYLTSVINVAIIDSMFVLFDVRRIEECAGTGSLGR